MKRRLTVHVLCSAFAMAASCLAPSASAAVTVRDAWVRGTVAGQETSGAYMVLTSSEDAALTAVSSPIARRVGIHSMRMDGGIMRMRAEPRLPLPAGKAVELGPSGYHLMLVGLSQPLAAGATVPLRLTFVDSRGATSTVDVAAPVRPLGASGAPAAATGAMHGAHAP